MIFPSLLLATLFQAGAQSDANALHPYYQLDYVSGSTKKVEQVNGDIDCESVYFGHPKPTASLTTTRADVLADGYGGSFEYNGHMIVFFGDTEGATSEFYPTYVSFIDNYAWDAHDPISWSDSTDPDKPLVVNFFKRKNGTTVWLKPLYGNGTGVPMRGDNIPTSGVEVNGQIYFIVSTGANRADKYRYTNAYSVLTTFDPNTMDSQAGRTISQANLGQHFVFTALHNYGKAEGSRAKPYVMIFGEGQYQRSNIFLSRVPADTFWSGKDTEYYAGTVHGKPKWSTDESKAVEIVADNPNQLNPEPQRTVTYLSVTYNSDLGLWLMTYTGGLGSPETKGEYFSYAPNPWGPWSTPQLIFNPFRDNGYGYFMHYYDAFGETGPAGPTAAPKQHDPNTTTGIDFAPMQIERFHRVKGDKFELSYNMSTWNPYVVVRMSSTFKIRTLP